MADVQSLLPQSHLKHKFPKLETNRQGEVHPGGDKTQKAVVVFRQERNQTVPDLPQNQGEGDSAQNDPDEGHHRGVPLEAVAVEPEQMYPHRLEPRLHQVSDGRA